MNKPTVHVAIALLFHQGQVLVGWREAKQHQGNKYEFPGGKVEDNETPVQACRRETFEEVGIDIERWFVFDEIHHEYDDLYVHLHLFHAGVESTQLSQINRPWTWYQRNQLKNLNFPKANDVIIQRLVWPDQMYFINDQKLDLNQYLLDQENIHIYWGRLNPNIATIESLNGLSDAIKARLMIDLEIFQQLHALEQRKYAAVCVATDQLNAVVAKINNIQYDRQKTNRVADFVTQPAINRAELLNIPMATNVLAYCRTSKDVQHALHLGCDAIVCVDDAMQKSNELKTIFTQAQDFTQGKHADADIEQTQMQCHVPVYL